MIRKAKAIHKANGTLDAVMAELEKKVSLNSKLEAVEKFLGTKGETNGEQLNTLAKKLFWSKFKGVFLVSTPQDVPSLQEGEIAILNRDQHWFGAFRKNGKLFESDSYGYDELVRNFSNQRIPPNFVQKPLDQNCGQRLILNLWRAFHK